MGKKSRLKKMAAAAAAAAKKMAEDAAVKAEPVPVPTVKKKSRKKKTAEDVGPAPTDKNGHLDEDRINSLFTSRVHMAKESTREFDASPYFRSKGNVPGLEVFDMYLINLTEVDLEIFGKIEVGGGIESSLIYDTPTSECDRLPAYGSTSLLMTGPKDMKMAVDFTISSYLCDKKTMSVVHTGFLHDRGYMRPFGYKPRQLRVTEDSLDERKKKTVLLVMRFVQYDNAVGARVKVKLSPSVGARAVNGLITASNSMFPHIYSNLFSKGNAVKVTEDGDEFVIPLSKDLVAVPIGNCIYIKADLPGIAAGTTEFKVGELNSTSTSNAIENLTVSVTWIV